MIDRKEDAIYLVSDDVCIEIVFGFCPIPGTKIFIYNDTGENLKHNDIPRSMTYGMVLEVLNELPYTFDFVRVEHFLRTNEGSGDIKLFDKWLR